MSDGSNESHLFYRGKEGLTRLLSPKEGREWVVLELLLELEEGGGEEGRRGEGVNITLDATLHHTTHGFLCCVHHGLLDLSVHSGQSVEPSRDTLLIE